MVTPSNCLGTILTKMYCATLFILFWMNRCKLFTQTNSPSRSLTLKRSLKVKTDFSITFRYRSNVKRLQSLLRDQLETPLERAVFWTEYVMRHKGASALELGSRNLYRFQRNLIDVYFILFTIFLFFMTTSTLTIRWVCFRRTKK